VIGVMNVFLGIAASGSSSLSAVAPGRYELMCLPIPLGDSDGAPCRAVLRDLET